MKRAIEKPLLKSLLLMASVIEARDAYTGGHLWRVSQYCGQLAKSAGMPPEMVFLSTIGGFLHDIGKVGIPDAILGKRGSLNELEYEVVKTHPGIGASLIQAHPLGDLAFFAVHQHHEWVNGSGYPAHLQQNQISLFARIVSIADAFDALTSTRPYRKRVDSVHAINALKENLGTQFDVRLLNGFAQLVGSDMTRGVAGFSEEGLPMIECPTCGPVISISRGHKDGSICHCRVCGSSHRLHRDGDTFMVEPTGTPSTAEELKPLPETTAIEALVASAPEWVDI